MLNSFQSKCLHALGVTDSDVAVIESLTSPFRLIRSGLFCLEQNARRLTG